MALAGAYSGIGLSLDEIQHCPDPDIAYTFSDGEERGRLSSDAKQKTRRSWQCIAWSTGEKKLEELVGENLKTRAFGVQSGREARFYDIPVSGTGSYKGAVESLNGFDTPEGLINAINRGTRQNYGFAGPEFVEKLIGYAEEHGEAALTSKINLTSDRVLAALDLAPDAHPVVRRVARAFAEVGAAGVLASEFGVIPNNADDLIDGIVKCFTDWLTERGSVQFTQAEIKPIIAIRDFISSNKLKFIDLSQPPEQKFGEVVGYTKMIDGEACYLFNNTSWEAVRRIGKRSNLAENLKERGLLVTKSGNSLKVQVRFKDLNGSEQRERFYAVSSRILLVDDFGQYVPPDTTDEDDELSNDHYLKAKRAGQRSVQVINGGKL